MELSEAQVWVLIAALVAMGILTKAVGPALVGGRDLPRWTSGVIAAMSPALLAALIATAVLVDDRRLGVGADTAGVAVAAILMAWLRVPLVASVAVAVVVTAGLRALT